MFVYVHVYMHDFAVCSMPIKALVYMYIYMYLHVVSQKYMYNSDNVCHKMRLISNLTCTCTS